MFPILLVLGRPNLPKGNNTKSALSISVKLTKSKCVNPNEPI